MGDSVLFNNRNSRNSSVSLRIITLVALAIVLICPTAWAVTKYKVIITVTDPGLSPPLTEQPISDADVKVKLSPWDEKTAVKEQNPGVYGIELTVNHDGQKQVKYDVTVSRSGYDTATQSLVLQSGDPVVKTMTFPLTRGTTIYYLHITLLDADTKEYIPGASVACAIETDFGGRGQANDLGARGGYHVSLSVDHRNYREVSCACTMSKRGYEDRTHRFFLKRGDKNTRSETLYLKPKLEPLERGQNIHVNVRRADDGRPVNRAHVSVGNHSGETDGNGEITLLVDTPGEGANREHNLTVRGDIYFESNLYEPIFKRIPVRLYDENKDRYWVCCLKPKGATGVTRNEGTCEEGRDTNRCNPSLPQISDNLIIIVEDGGDTSRLPGERLKVHGVAVVITKQSGASETKPTVNGEAKFSLDPVKDKEQSIEVQVQVPKDSDYIGTYTKIPAENFKSFTQPVKWFVTLQRRDKVADKINELNGKVTAGCSGLNDACNDIRGLDQVRLDHGKEWDSVVLWFNPFQVEAEKVSVECGTTASIRAMVKSYASAVKTDAAVLRAKVNAANTKASVCKTQEDIKDLETLWSEILALSWKVYNGAQSAATENAKLKGVITRAASVKARFSTKDQNTPVPLNDVLQKLGDITSSLKKHRDGVFKTAFNTVATKRKDCIKAHDDAIREIDSLKVKNDQRIEAFKKDMSARKPQPPNPCDENALKRDLDNAVQFFETNKELIRKRVESVQKLPLCSGEKPEDGVAVEAFSASNAVLTELQNSGLRAKIDACRGKPAVTQPTPPSTPSTTKPTKPWNAFGIHPPRVTLARGQSQEFKAYLVYTDGTSDDISQWCAWSPSRVFKADKIGTWLVKAEAKLDVVRVDYAVIKVPGALSISGPDRGSPGTRATFSVTGLGAQPGAKEYQFRWYGDGKQLSSQTDSQLISLQTPGKHVITAKVWNWSGAKWEAVGEKSKAFFIEKSSDPGSAKGPYTKGRMIGSAQIPARNTKPTRVTGVLEKGKPYIVVGKGSVSLWDGQTDGCDSVFRYKTPLEKGGGPLKIWGQLNLINPTARLSDLIKEQTGKDPIYNSGHVYEAVVTGQGLQFEAIVYDGGGYGDNHGELTVEVYEAIPMN